MNEEILNQLANINIITATYVFIAVFIVDVVWVFYIKRTNESRAVVASNFAVLVYGLGSVAIVAYNKEYIYIIPALIGAWIGTYCAIKFIDYLKRKDGE